MLSLLLCYGKSEFLKVWLLGLVAGIASLFSVQTQELSSAFNCSSRDLFVWEHMYFHACLCKYISISIVSYSYDDLHKHFILYSEEIIILRKKGISFNRKSSIVLQFSPLSDLFMIFTVFTLLGLIVLFLSRPPSS